MTIALGILATDGLVIAADTEEAHGYAGGIKRDAFKIQSTVCGATMGEPQGSIGISGAGHADYLDSVMPKVSSAISDAYGKLSVNLSEDIQAAIEGATHAFYHRHVMPFLALPDGNEKPDFSLIVATQKGKTYDLWTTSKTTVHNCGLYGAVGVGSTYANMLLGKMIRRVDVSIAKILAAYVIFRVKETIEGCGKATDIVCLKDGQSQYVLPSEIDRMEQHFRDYEFAESSVFYHTIGYTFGDTKEDFQYITGRLRNLRRAFAPDQVAKRGPRSTRADPSPPPPSQASHGGSGGS